VPEPQGETQPEPPPPVGRFDPAAFRARDETPTTIDWRPGTLVSLDFGNGSLFEKIPPLFVTGVVTGGALVLFLGAAEVPGRWLWGVLAGIAAVAVRTMIERSQLRPRQVRFDWSTRTAKFVESGVEETIPFDEIDEIVLRGHVLHLGPRRTDERAHFHWCEVVVVADVLQRVVAISTKIDEDKGDAAYAMSAPMAAELAGALSVPWRWTRFESEHPILDSV
jgi:hypothetical protein